MELLDTTLREGEQAAGIMFSLAQKKKILYELDDFGMDFIEIGHPAVNEKIMNDVAELAKIKTEAMKLVHSRAMEKDIMLASGSGADYVWIFLCTSELGMNAKYSFSWKEALSRINGSVRLARKEGLKVRFTAEDAT